MARKTRYYVIPNCFIENEFKDGFDLQDLEDFAFFTNLKSVKEELVLDPDSSVFKVSYEIEKESRVKPPKHSTYKFK